MLCIRQAIQRIREEGESALTSVSEGDDEVSLQLTLLLRYAHAHTYVHLYMHLYSRTY